MSDPLTTAVVNMAKHVPIANLANGAAAIEHEAAFSTAAEQRLRTADPSPGYALHIASVADAWRDAQELPGRAVAAALRAAGTAVSEERRDNRLSLVWTGPPTSEITLRSTRAVLNTLVAQATDTLVLVSYAGYDVDDLATNLRTAIDRGVEVTLILETKTAGGLSVEPADAFTMLRGRARFYTWPPEQREAHHASTARLHAKCAIKDRRDALITSANLTAAAINDNMELGVLIQASAAAERLHRHFELLIHDEILMPI